MRGYPRPITTIVTPAPGYALTDLASVKTELNLADADLDRDDVLTRYIKSASAAVSQFCNRVVVKETVRDTFYLQRDERPYAVRGGADPLQLSRWPIAAVASVVENGTALTEGADFVADAENGQLIRLGATGAPRRWNIWPLVVQYDGGFAVVPDDIADACIEFVKFRYFARTRDPGLKSENVVGVYEASYLWGTGPGGPGDMPAAVAAKLDRYRVPVIA